MSLSLGLTWKSWRRKWTHSRGESFVISYVPWLVINNPSTISLRRMCFGASTDHENASCDLRWVCVCEQASVSGNAIFEGYKT